MFKLATLCALFMIASCSIAHADCRRFQDVRIFKDAEAAEQFFQFIHGQKITSSAEGYVVWFSTTICVDSLLDKGVVE